MHDRTDPAIPDREADAFASLTNGFSGVTDESRSGSSSTVRNRFCADCGHQRQRHESTVEEDFAVSHGGVGYAYCQDVVRRGESADICACRIVVGTSSGARAALWPTDRPRLATIPSPGASLTLVRLLSTEVTTTDPITGQPDFETIEIAYVPDGRLIDTKSLKAYWSWWRGRGASMERLSSLVADDVAEATRARSVEVIVTEAPRGGISIIATSRVERA
jgi:NADPH-dependent 7-cyano-7-deazaguanine reductase QueF